MELPLPLSQRPLELLLREAVLARANGLVVVRDREDVRHGVWLRGGYALGAHVAGRFDPLLELLRQRGRLSERAHRVCVGALPDVAMRAGELATALCGVPPAEVREVLRAQLVGRVAALVRIAASEGHDAWLERCEVPEAEQSLCMPMGSLLRRGELATAPASGRDAARRRLRALAKQLHPDRHPGLDAAAQQLLASQLAAATAAYHGFS